MDTLTPMSDEVIRLLRQRVRRITDTSELADVARILDDLLDTVDHYRRRIEALERRQPPTNAIGHKP